MLAMKYYTDFYKCIRWLNTAGSDAHELFFVMHEYMYALMTYVYHTVCIRLVEFGLPAISHCLKRWAYSNIQDYISRALCQNEFAYLNISTRNSNYS